jgi:hypothetical protein
MSTVFPSRPVHADWKTLYQAAILEPDESVMRRKVCEAEAAILARGRELFYCGGTSDEQESLEEALYLLRAYRNAREHADGVTGSAAKSAA